MDKTVVIFESKYGSTKRYAQWISEALCCPLFERKDFRPQDFGTYNVIIYGGGLYAGGVSGIKLITGNWSLISDKKIILFTCGLADPNDPVNVSHIRRSLAAVLSSDMMDCIKLYHLRGGIDYHKLSFVHKAMMAMLRRMLLKREASELSNEDRQLLDTYGKKIDFIDHSTIQPLTAYVKELPASSRNL